MKVNNGIESDNVEKKDKQGNPSRRRDLLRNKLDAIDVSALMNHHQDWEGWYLVMLDHC